MCSREQESSCKCFILGGCHFANKGWMVYILTVLSGSVYPAGYSLSAHWMHSPLFIHSFPRGQVLSLWWIGAGPGQLFSLDGTSLTCSELKRPPCQSSFATSVLFRSPHKGCRRLHTYADTSSHCLTSLGCFLLEFPEGFEVLISISSPAFTPLYVTWRLWTHQVQLLLWGCHPVEVVRFFWEHLPLPPPLNWTPVHYDKSLFSSWTVAFILSQDVQVKISKKSEANEEEEYIINKSEVKFMTVRFSFIVKLGVKSVWQQYTEAQKSIQHLNNKDLSHQTTVCTVEPCLAHICANISHKITRKQVQCVLHKVLHVARAAVTFSRRSQQTLPLHVILERDNQPQQPVTDDRW